MIHCQLQNKAYENDVPDAHIVPHSGKKKQKTPPPLYIIYYLKY